MHLLFPIHSVECPGRCHYQCSIYLLAAEFFLYRHDPSTSISFNPPLLASLILQCVVHAYNIMIYYNISYNLTLVSYFSINLDFFTDVETCIPRHRSHLLRAGIVALSSGSSSLAPGTSSSISSSWLAITVFSKNNDLHAQLQTRVS